MNKVTGSGLPAQIWHDFMAQATQGQPARELPGQLLARMAPPAAADQGASGLLDRIGRFLSGGGTTNVPSATPEAPSRSFDRP